MLKYLLLLLPIIAFAALPYHQENNAIFHGYIKPNASTGQQLGDSTHSWSVYSDRLVTNLLSGAVYTDSSGQIKSLPNVSSVELGYLDGVTSALQTQIDSKSNYSSFITNGVVYPTNSSTVTSTGAGSSNTVLHGRTGLPPNFSSVDLNADSSGVLGVSKGGLGVATTPSNGQVPIGGSAGYTVTNITGTANRVTVTNGDGSIALSGPQDIGTASTPTFASVTLSNFSQNAVPFFQSGGQLYQDPTNFYYNISTGRWGFGTNANTYRMHLKMAGATAADALVLEGSGSGATRYWHVMPDSSGFLYVKNLNESYYSLVLNNMGYTGIGKASPLAQLDVAPRDASTVVTSYNSFLNQTADFAKWKTSTGVVLASIDATANASFPSMLLKDALKIEDPGSGTASITLQAPSGLASSKTYTLPATSTDNSVLHSTAAGVQSFSSVDLSADTAATALPATKGGTGTTTNTNHGVLLGAGTSPVSATSAGASNTVLHGNTGADPSFSSVDLSADTAATALPISKGGSGQTTKTAAFDALSPNTTAGDISYFDGSNNVRLAVGSNASVLTVDTSLSGKIKWAAASGGGGTSYSWSGYVQNNDTIFVNGTSYADFSVAGSGPTFTERTNNGFGTVTCYQVSAKCSAGIVFTPPTTGYYYVSAVAMPRINGNAQGAIRMTDGTTTVAEVSFEAANSATSYPIPIVGIYQATSTSSKTIKLQGLNSGGFEMDILSLGSPTGGTMIEWTIFKIN